MSNQNTLLKLNVPRARITEEQKNESDLLQSEAADFSVKEMFVSRTDKRGIISECNSVFERISEFSKDELISSPHNIIRHSDMPKCIFKLVWTRLKNNLNTAGFVKNKSKTGKYYWVLANFYVEDDGLFSIRVKPLSSHFEIIKSLYIELIKIEETKSVEKSSEYLMECLQKLGFANYDQFMSTVLKDELELRLASRALNKSKLISVHSTDFQKMNLELKNVELIKSNLEKSLDSISEVVRGITKSRVKEIQDIFNTDTFGRVCNRLEVLSVNMCITANKMANEGAALYVVANTFQATTQKFLKVFNEFKKSLENFKTQLQKSENDLCQAYFLNEMLHFTVKNEVGNDVSDFFLNNLYLFKTARFYFCDIKKTQSDFIKNLHLTIRHSKILFQNLVRIELIKTGGKIEGSRSDELTRLFGPFIDEMDRFVEEFKTPTEKIINLLSNHYELMQKAIPLISNMDFLLNETLTYLVTDNNLNEKNVA